MPKTRTIIVDDHSLMREGFKSLVQKHADCYEFAAALSSVQEARDYIAGLPAFAKGGANAVAVVDLDLNHEWAFPLIQAFCSRGVRCLIYSMFNSAAFVYEAMRQGAMGFVFKGEKEDVLLAALDAVSCGKTYLPPDIEDVLNRTSPVFDMFTPRERELVTCLTQGMDTDGVCAVMGLSERTVQNYLARIYDKVGVRSRHELIEFLQGKGGAL